MCALNHIEIENRLLIMELGRVKKLWIMHASLKVDINQITWNEYNEGYLSFNFCVSIFTGK